MPTLHLSRGIRLAPADDPLDGPGCHVVTEARRGVSRGWLALLRPEGGRRPEQPAREVYHPSPGLTLRTFVDLEPGTYEAHSALDDRRAHRVVFEVEGRSELLSRFRIVTPAQGKPEQLALWDPCRDQTPAGALVAGRLVEIGPDGLPRSEPATALPADRTGNRSTRAADAPDGRSSRGADLTVLTIAKNGSLDA